MALFSRKTQKTKDAPKAKAPVKTEAAPVRSSAADLSHVITGPRITEKATLVAEQNVYAFNVAPDATKERIKKAVQALYKVTPRQVRIVAIPKKRVVSARSRKASFVGGGKKAYVFLKEGDKIEFA